MRDRIATCIEISFTQLDPPEGLAVRLRQRGNVPIEDPQAFVGWLGLFGVLQSLTAEGVERTPP